MKERILLPGSRHTLVVMYTYKLEAVKEQSCSRSSCRCAWICSRKCVAGTGKILILCIQGWLRRVFLAPVDMLRAASVRAGAAAIWFGVEMERGVDYFIAWKGMMEVETISWQEFAKVELRVGTIVEVADFPEARKPAYKITADFGPEVGILRSSAQVTDLYAKAELVGRQIIGVVNFPSKQIGPVRSEFLVTGFYREDGAVVLAVPDRQVGNGAKLG